MCLIELTWGSTLEWSGLCSRIGFVGLFVLTCLGNVTEYTRVIFNIDVRVLNFISFKRCNESGCSHPYVNQLYSDMREIFTFSDDLVLFVPLWCKIMIQRLWDSYESSLVNLCVILSEQNPLSHFLAPELVIP
jgi:hypothetical protein